MDNLKISSTGEKFWSLIFLAFFLKKNGFGRKYVPYGRMGPVHGDEQKTGVASHRLLLAADRGPYALHRRNPLL